MRGRRPVRWGAPGLWRAGRRGPHTACGGVEPGEAPGLWRARPRGPHATCGGAEPGAAAHGAGPTPQPREASAGSTASRSWVGLCQPVSAAGDCGGPRRSRRNQAQRLPSVDARARNAAGTQRPVTQCQVAAPRQPPGVKRFSQTRPRCGASRTVPSGGLLCPEATLRKEKKEKRQKPPEGESHSGR